MSAFAKLHYYATLSRKYYKAVAQETLPSPSFYPIVAVIPLCDVSVTQIW
jgi:hypothetical protein